MKFLAFSLLLALAFQGRLRARSIFLPENGSYRYNLAGITLLFQTKNMDYVVLRSGEDLTSKRYRLDRKRNEFRIKDWFQRDWYSMQDMFQFDEEGFMRSQNASTFVEAKREQFSHFAFDRDDFFHYKTTPAMKEWGGLTHPPVKTLTLPLERYHAGFKKKDYGYLESPYFDPAFQRELDQVSHSELTFGNEVRALADHKAYLKKLSLIRHAQESILMSSLVYVCDDSTSKLVDLLIEKHAQGVDVKILTDGMIGRILGYRECLKLMRGAGIEVVETKDFFKHEGKAIYHTKTLIVDFKEAMAGGQNMIDADNMSLGTNFMNRDVDLYVKGPMVTDIARQFVENWEYQKTLNKNLSGLTRERARVQENLRKERQDRLRGPEVYADILNSSARMKGVCRFIKQAPYEDGRSIGRAYLKLLDKVDSYIALTNPIVSDTYLRFPVLQAPLIERMDSFKMYNQLHQKIQALVKAGKKMDYLTTSMNMAGNENVALMDEAIKEELDQGKKLRANWSLAKLEFSNNFYGNPHYKNLLKDWYPLPNVHVWNHISFLHSKILYLDRTVSSIGSYNLQHNATDHAYESTSVCMDERLNHDLDEILVQDMVNSIPLIFSRLQ